MKHQLNMSLANPIANDIDLLESENEFVRGSYNPMQFVLRLNREVYDLIKSVPSGINSSHIMTISQKLAYSTYLHENIHWWQHVGSNFGLISSLKFPAQAHLNYTFLKQLIREEGPFKSLIEYDYVISKAGITDKKLINGIINNWKDLQITSDISFNPYFIDRYSNDKYFLSIGHSQYITWSAALQTLAKSVDDKFSFLPNPREWSKGFSKLKVSKTLGYDPDAKEVFLPAFGSKAIFEGQARLSQIQFLHLAFQAEIDFQGFKEIGFLEGIYGEAFKYYLAMVGEEMPKSPDDSLVGLFLLICDIAINPTDGFPFDIDHYESFLYTNDPGFRFHLLCLNIKNKFPELKKKIVNYSREEYIEVSKILCDSIGCASPFLGMTLIKKWVDHEESIKKLLEEEKASLYDNINLPVRLFFSKFLRFQIDKFDTPHLFCWPGMTLIQHENFSNSQKFESTFERHRALFVDQGDGEVRYTLFNEANNENWEKTFNNFFMWNCQYDMVRQWITEEGPFLYNYNWLTPRYSNLDFEKIVGKQFQEAFGVNPQDFKILLFED